MGRPKKEQTDHTRNIVLSYIRENVDEDGYTKMNISSVSMDRGISYSSVKNALKSLAVDGKIEYTNTDDVIDQSGRVNRGFLVHLIGNVQPLIVPVKVEAPVRKCEKCGTDAPEEESKTGYEVGDSVIILKDAIREFQKKLNLPGGEWIDLLPNGPVKIESMPLRNEIHVEGFPYIFLHPDWIRHADKLEVRVKPLGIERVLFNKPATIVFWTDGTKTVVKCRKGDEWDAEKGLAMACAKKLLGNDDGYHKALAKLYSNSEPTPDKMRMELHKYCKGRWCGNCIMDKHRKDPRCVCGMGHSFTLDKNSPAYISDADIRFFYKWLKDGLRDG